MYSRMLHLYVVFVATVIVQSNAGIPPLDEETILFLEDKMVLGKVIKFSRNLTVLVTSFLLLTDYQSLAAVYADCT